MALIEWLVCGDTGVSSKTIVHVMEGTPPPSSGVNVPHDPGDFGRCHKLLEAVPAYRARLGEVAARYPEWVGLVREWDRLTVLYVAAIDSGRRTSRELYDAMQSLIDEWRLAAGWVRTSWGWTRGKGME